jgi:hypothetical protein
MKYFLLIFLSTTFLQCKNPKSMDTKNVKIHALRLKPNQDLSMSDSLGVTTGGHLLDENLIYTTAEIVISESKNHIFTREKDGSTPL